MRGEAVGRVEVEKGDKVMKILCDRKRPPKKKLVIVGTCYMCDSKLICEQAVDAWSAWACRRVLYCKDCFEQKVKRSDA